MRVATQTVDAPNLDLGEGRAVSSWDLKMRFDGPLSRMNRQMVSMGFNAGGNGGSMMLAGPSSLAVGDEDGMGVWRHP